MEQHQTTTWQRQEDRARPTPYAHVNIAHIGITHVYITHVPLGAGAADWAST